MRKNKYLILGLILVVCLLLNWGLSRLLKRIDNDKEKEQDKPIVVENDYDFNVSIIKNSFEKKNYLISPYSIEVALNMLREGTDGNSKVELDKVLGTRIINNLQIDKKLGIANALFIKDDYKDNIKKSFIDTIDEKYQAEVLFDKFETPDVINNWVKEKTNEMIPKILDSMDPYFVFGLANAISLDVKWLRPFECNDTRSKPFKLAIGEEIEVEMMHHEYNSDEYKYLNEDGLKGIILPYEEEENIKLEFIALMPDDIEKYIHNFDSNSIKMIDEKSKSASKELNISLSLPRFTYEYEIQDFIGVLNKMGIHDVFDGKKANFTKATDMDIFVDTAIHKTKIELSEKGTKAAAVTYFGTKANGIILDKPEMVEINFNKPFIYLIRDSVSKEILFFGSVYEPNVWKGSTCSE